MDFGQLHKVIISRTDSIGDVCLTLPICAELKVKFPNLTLIFLGKKYTQAVIEACPFVDQFLDFDNLKDGSEQNAVSTLNKERAEAIIHVFPNKLVAKWAKKARIPNRIGTSHRVFHWWTCNHRINFTRKNSALHESQLNFELLKPFGVSVPDFSSLSRLKLLQAKIENNFINQLIINNKRSIILHPKSQGSAVEWGLGNFVNLAEKLAENGAQVFFTGTENEGNMFRNLIPKHPSIHDLTGKMSLPELISFIDSCDCLVAASTGPLHLAGLLGTKAIGLFSPRKPIHPGRWKPLGTNSTTLVFDENCQKCNEGQACDCIQSISVERVLEQIFIE